MAKRKPRNKTRNSRTMQKEKSITKWLKEIPDKKIRDLAIINNKLYPPAGSENKEVNCLKDAIYYGFIWNKTPEGSDFWLDEYRKCVSYLKVEDKVNNPSHYNSHPSGVECIQVAEHLNFCLGNAIKYIWRADDKENDIEDLRKAAWYVNREIERRLKARK